MRKSNIQNNSIKSIKPQSINDNIKEVTPSAFGFGISLKSLQKNKNKGEEEKYSNQSYNIENEKEFSQKQLEDSWLKFAQTINEDHHFRNSLCNCLPQKISDNTLEVVVDNPVQGQKIADVKVRIVNFLRKELFNDKIQMLVRINSGNERKVAFTPKEKFELMAEENKNLLLLKEKLNLDLL